MKPEIRSFDVTELRVADDGAGGQVLTGHAAVFNQLSVDLGGFREKIEPGAFADSLLADDIRALWNHDSNLVLGRNRAGTLQLAEDERGLAVKITPPPAQWARDAMVTIGRGDVSQMSFMFDTITDSWQIVEGENIRTLHKVRAWEVSPVTFPAYPQTEIGLRAAPGLMGGVIEDLARLVVRREHGLTVTDAELDRMRRAVTGWLSDTRDACGLNLLRNRLEIALRT